MVEDASRLSENDAEEAAHKLFRRLGLTFNVKISWATVDLPNEALKVAYIKPSDFLSYLLENHPELVWADGVPELRCEAFWRAYFQSHPSHEVFRQFAPEQLKYIIPLIVHGDEGTGNKKQPVSIVSWQTPWGTPTQARKFAKRKHISKCGQCSSRLWKPCCSHPTSAEPSAELSELLQLRPEDIAELERQWPTAAGHSYFSRHLLLVLPPTVVFKGPEVLSSMLSTIAADLKHLFWKGTSVQGRTFHVGFLGCKGDAKWHVATGNLERSFFHLGGVKDYEICPYCLAGNACHPFEDCSSTASWVATMFTSVPWTKPGPFEAIPFDPSMPAAKFRRDPLHVFKIGLARDLIGSLIVLLATFFQVWDWPGDTIGLWPRLGRAHSRFRLWCQSEKEIPNFKSFTKDFMHMSLVTDYPYTGSKGSDSMLLIRWLSFELSMAIRSNQHERLDLLRVALQVTKASTEFFRTLYSHGLWLGHDCMVAIRNSVLTVTRGYSYLADACVKLNFSGFSLKTTLHSWHHFAIEIDQALQRGCKCFPNPLMFDCCQDEDFVGRTAKVSRSVHARTSSQRCLQRHLLKKQALCSKRKSQFKKR